jgi:hypothetical protein
LFENHPERTVILRGSLDSNYAVTPNGHIDLIKANSGHLVLMFQGGKKTTSSFDISTRSVVDLESWDLSNIGDGIVDLGTLQLIRRISVLIKDHFVDLSEWEILELN